MDCPTARERLSAYFDGELPKLSETDVARHLENCAECRQEISRYRQLSRLATRLKSVTRPNQFATWQQILDKQSESCQVKTAAASRKHWRSLAATVVTTAGVLLAVLGWHWYRHSHGLEASFDRFLGAFLQSPEQADTVLSEIYSGRSVSLDEAEKLLKYRPVVAKGLPQGYSLVSAYVIKMPCCTCLQANLRNSAGRGIVVFEHDGHQPHWFGNRPAIDTFCQGQPTRLVQLDGSVAATGRCGQRYLTMIGPRDLGEVDQLTGFWLRDVLPPQLN